MYKYIYIYIYTHTHFSSNITAKMKLMEIKVNIQNIMYHGNKGKHLYLHDNISMIFIFS